MWTGRPVQRRQLLRGLLKVSFVAFMVVVGNRYYTLVRKKEMHSCVKHFVSGNVFGIL